MLLNWALDTYTNTTTQMQMHRLQAGIFPIKNTSSQSASESWVCHSIQKNTKTRMQMIKFKQTYKKSKKYKHTNANVQIHANITSKYISTGSHLHNHPQRLKGATYYWKWQYTNDWLMQLQTHKCKHTNTNPSKQIAIHNQKYANTRVLIFTISLREMQMFKYKQT